MTESNTLPEKSPLIHINRLLSPACEPRSAPIGDGRLSRIGLDKAFRDKLTFIPDHAPPATLVLKVGMRTEEEGLDLRLDHLLQHAPGRRTQDLEQWVVRNTPSWLRQPDDGILLHGVSSQVTSNITEDTERHCRPTPAQVCADRIA